MTGETITVRKLNLQGEETWRYSGIALQQSPTRVLLEARFDRPDIPFHGILLRFGDRFVEEYTSDHWYNIFEIHDLDDDQIKGWYCNISHPAILEHLIVTYVDLALDLLVYADGNQLVLDMDEFDALPLSQQDRVQALAALSELKEFFRKKFTQ